MNNYQYSKNLKIIPFGGVGNVTKNMFVYEHANDILIVDCGIGFPDEEVAEEELLIPDFSYLLSNKNKIRGLVVSHAHFDHYGAIPYLLEKINIPIFATRLASEYIKEKLEEHGISLKSVRFRIIKAGDENIRIGAFKVTPFHVNHSVPKSLGLFINTPAGNAFHVADYKFDWTPVKEKPFDIQKAAALAAGRRPLLLLSDCLGANRAGHTRSEKTIQENFENIISRAKGLVLVTTVSSNISRIRQAIQASRKLGRKAAFLGHSVEKSYEIANRLGYFKDFTKDVISQKKIKKFPPQKLTLIVAGSYGQPNSALERISRNKHYLVKLRKDDVVIFSADPSPPSVVVSVNNMIDNLTKLGVDVHYYEIQENLYVSGHGTAEDLKMLFALIKARYVLPIGGDFRHMRAYANLACQMGYEEKEVLLLEEGKAIEVSKGGQVLVK